jgi:AcrR family transcriptional regulator
MSATERRPYDSPVRRQRAAETRERIVAAGAELVHGFTRWDWRDLTVRAVARRAGVNERTVYRHFAGERELHDAVMARLVEEVGDPLDGLTLDGFADGVARLFAYLSSFATAPRTATDPTFAAVDAERRAALVAALEPSTEGWDAGERAMAAALLDVLWSVTTYERMVGAWGLTPEQASTAATGLAELLAEGLRAGRRPWRPEGPG